MTKCKCRSYCEPGRHERRDFRQDHGSDGWEDTPYVRIKRKTPRGVCSKSKTGEACKRTIRMVRWSSRPRTETRLQGTPWETEVQYVEDHIEMACERCGSIGWSWQTVRRYLNSHVA